MRYLVGFVLLLLALGTLRMVGCGDEGEGPIPCEQVLDCPPAVQDECYISVKCLSNICRYLTSWHGAGCILEDGDVGVCLSDPNGCTEESGPIPCKHGSQPLSDWPDGTPCRSEDLHKGTCINGMCGPEGVCEGVVCDEPGICGSDPFCNWEGVCEFREPNLCSDGNACTFDECYPDIGCVHYPGPDGATCALPDANLLCCLACLGYECECCDYGICMGGICFPD
jgi:hypothetical protein